MDRNKNLLSMLWSAAIVICVVLSLVALGVSAFAGQGGAERKAAPPAAAEGKSASKPASASSKASASAPSPLAVSSVTADRNFAAVGDTVTWTAEADGGSGELQYCFYVYKDDEILQKGSYGTENLLQYTLDAEGSYSVKAFVRDGDGTKASRTGGAVTVNVSGAPSVSSVRADRSTAKPGETVCWTATASGGSGTLEYCFYLYRDGKVLEKGKYGASSSCSYTPTEAGSYSAKAFVRDSAGATASRIGDAVTVK